MSNPGLKCSVTSCEYNERGIDCSLEMIQVAPCAHSHNGEPADESMCGSYKNK